MNSVIKFEKEDLEKSINERFEKIVDLYPEKIAVDTGKRTITYQVLNQKANQLARTILNQCDDVQEPILILADNEIDIILSILAILKAGKFHCLLTPFLPKERLKQIRNEIQAPLIVTNSQNIILAEELAQNKLSIINIESVDSNIDYSNLNLSISPEFIAFVSFTSGSTGKPKGIINSHRFILHRLYSNITNNNTQINDNFLSIINSSFISVERGILTYLLSGATVVCYPFKSLGILPLKHWLINKNITITNFTSQVFQQLLNNLNQDDYFPSLRQINILIEKLYTKDIETFFNHVSRDCILKHGYGSSETGSIARNCLKSNAQLSGNVLPVGYASPDKEIKILDEEGKELGFNQVGEIAVKSRYLSPGYWRNPQLTKKKFLPDTDDRNLRTYLTGDLGILKPDGCLELLGRQDFMVKIRGFRVELGEIEANLREHPYIKQTVVIAKGDKPENKKLIAYFVPINTENVNNKQLREFLEEKLPDYMIPSTFLSLESFPLTPNGKIDLKALPDPNFELNSEQEFIAPQTFTEKQVTNIWSEILAIEKIGINDNFLVLGGSSLLATRIISRLNQKLGIEIPLKSFFESPTIAQLSNLIKLLLEKESNYSSKDQEEIIFGEI